MRKLDQIAWRQIESRPVPQGNLARHWGLVRSGRPCSFDELEQVLREGADFTIAWCEFLDEFYLFRRVQFFEEPPSEYFDAKTRAWFAGVVEWLAHKFGLPVPPWTERDEFFLDTYWQKTEDSGDSEFSRRGIAYDPSHHLIRL